mmetsp:Transcript_44876/g.124459  ORF Transcript_44876/g.124459 Transcript_44876/m.124459 type:complete len:423 (+) Transcript_44876:439-1707(+)
MEKFGRPFERSQSARTKKEVPKERGREGSGAPPTQSARVGSARYVDPKEAKRPGRQAKGELRPRRTGERRGGQGWRARRAGLGPQLEERIPAAGAERLPVDGDAEARDAVVVAGEDSHLLAGERVPDVAVEVIVAGEEEAARDGVGDRSDAAKDLVVRVLLHLLVRAQVEEAARGVVRAGGESLAVGEEMDGVDIRLVARERVRALLFGRAPHLGGRVARARDERLSAAGDRNAHHVAIVFRVLLLLRAGGDVPQHATHVARRGEDLLVVDEAAARQVARVGRELTRDLDGLVLRVEVVDRADVVQAAARDVPAPRRKRASHHPRGTERDRVDLVGGEGVPHNQLAVLRRRHQVARARLPLSPVHRVDFREVALEDAAVLDRQLRDRGDTLVLQGRAAGSLGCPQLRDLILHRRDVTHGFRR